MIRLLRDNWIWVALPFALVFLGMAALILISDGSDGAPPFIYTIF